MCYVAFRKTNTPMIACVISAVSLSPTTPAILVIMFVARSCLFPCHSTCTGRLARVAAEE
ncbi:hypothetical protein BDU57DRAFT_508404 [Ampelomyces quisqualis]|uniref:Uncharacterized protein n=1 Tax=Ampelomyces quisqualis TaxID=50730 RepID=A0A6A5R078_AMPQU|nr:hypothetical protein BDU57DRAFT_508404 [Ampelomyces quisqualis]